MRIFHRVDRAAARLDQHAATAEALTSLFANRPFVTDVISPARENNPSHARFKEYFGKGNGLFTMEFKEKVPPKQINNFVDSLLLFRIAESWGGHVSLVLPVHPPHGDKSSLPKGPLFRFYAGLEDAGDLLKDLAQASRAFAGNSASLRHKTTSLAIGPT